VWKLDEDVKTSAGSVAAGRCGDGPPLILAHGWPWSSFSWHRIIPKLALAHTVYWYDMPGYGKSAMNPDQRTSLDIQGDVFAEMLRHWELDSPTVIAHDFGGATTLRAHLLHGCEYEKYILMNVVAMRPWGSEFFDHVGRHVEAFQGLPAHIHKAIVEAYIRGAMTNPIADEDFHALVSPWVSTEGSKSFYAQFAQADEKYTAEIEPDFGNIRCPVKILWGGSDPWIPLERCKALHGLIPQSSFDILPDLGHLPQLENPELVADKILNFVSD